MRRPVNRGQRQLVVSLPAPVGGLNARDAWDGMAPTDAIELTNWYPEADAVVTRDGYAQKVGSLSAAVETLAEWRGPATKTLLGAYGGKLSTFDLGAGTASELATGISEDAWQHCNFAGYLVLVNGTDAPRIYNGSLNTTTFTGSGLTIANLIQVEPYKERLWFVEKNTAKAWYGDVGNVTGGTLTAFDAGQIARQGGGLQAIGSWSQDSGTGKDDVLVLVMDSGELLIYAGSDPGDATDFGLIGRYTAGRPIGRRCLAKVGGELVILTRSGILPVSVFLRGGTVDSVVNDPLWGKIRPAVQDMAASYGGNSGWEIFVTPDQSRLYVVVPVGGSVYEHLVVNLSTGAWCKYQDLPAATFGSQENGTYFGSSAAVNQVSGNSDGGSDIVSRVQCSFQYLGGRGQRKKITKVRPVMNLSGQMTATLGVNVNFGQRDWPSGNVTLRNPDAGGSDWDGPDWDEGDWGGTPGNMYRWYSAGGTGNSFGLFLEVRGQQQVRWFSTDLGGYVGANW